MKISVALHPPQDIISLFSLAILGEMHIIVSLMITFACAFEHFFIIFLRCMFISISLLLLFYSNYGVVRRLLVLYVNNTVRFTQHGHFLPIIMPFLFSSVSFENRKFKCL